MSIQVRYSRVALIVSQSPWFANTSPLSPGRCGIAIFAPVSGATAVSIYVRILVNHHACAIRSGQIPRAVVTCITSA